MTIINTFLNEQTARGTRATTVRHYAHVLKKLNEYKPIETITKNDLIEYFNNFKCADSTRMVNSIIIKKFFNSIGHPEVSSWLNPKRPHETLKSDDILDASDVNKMLEATDSLYWKALIAILYESGARIGEIQTLKYKDFIDTKEGLIVNIPTYKTAAGFRKMILINSAEYIRNLKNSVNGKPDDIVFSIRYRYTSDVIRDIGRAAGIRKPVSCHRFRHARATAAISEMPEAIIRKMLGWSQNSTMISRYQHLSDESVIEAQLGKNGDKKELTKLNPSEKIDLTPVYKKLEEENFELKKQLSDAVKDISRIKNAIEFINKLSKESSEKGVNPLDGMQILKLGGIKLEDNPKPSLSKNFKVTEVQ